jgi:hypothetical protein
MVRRRWAVLATAVGTALVFVAVGRSRDRARLRDRVEFRKEVEWKLARRHRRVT